MGTWCYDNGAEPGPDPRAWLEVDRVYLLDWSSFGDAQWASVEPSGLQVVGVLDTATWQDWDERFQAAVVDRGLPLRDP